MTMRAVLLLALVPTGLVAQEPASRPAGLRFVEDTESVIRVLNSDGEIIEIDPADVEERRPDLSAMPEDLLKDVTREELRDLLEYLASL